VFVGGLSVQCTARLCHEEQTKFMQGDTGDNWESTVGRVVISRWHRRNTWKACRFFIGSVLEYSR